MHVLKLTTRCCRLTSCVSWNIAAVLSPQLSASPALLLPSNRQPHPSKPASSTHPVHQEEQHHMDPPKGQHRPLIAPGVRHSDDATPHNTPGLQDIPGASDTPPCNSIQSRVHRVPSVEERWFWPLLRASPHVRPLLCTIPCFMYDWVAELMARRREEGFSIAALQCRPRHWGERSRQLLAVSVEMGLDGCLLRMEVVYSCAICANW